MEKENFNIIKKIFSLLKNNEEKDFFHFSYKKEKIFA
jgi:hypothetical protein